MLRSFSLTALLLASSSPAFAERPEDNAVKAADDAFGTSVGNEKIGLYSAVDVRGFSPTAAGNIRLEGLSLTEHGGFNNRIVSGSTIRVGLTAQGYPFPAPTGIADYTLRNSGNEAVLSPVIYLGPYGTAALDLDGQIPIVPDRLSLAAGLSYKYEENFPGEDSRILQAGSVLRWQPSKGVQFKSFYARTQFTDDRDIGNILTAGPYLPPVIERRFFGLDWTRTDATRQFYGTSGSFQLTDAWQLRAGLFRSENEAGLNPVELYRNVQPDGSALHTVVTTRGQRAASTSGELRSSHSITEGNRRHTLHLALRGRETHRRYGGSDVRDFGPAMIGESADIEKPEFLFGQQTRDEVNQFTTGLGYELRWAGVAEASLGLQRADYRKTILVPEQPAITTRDKPWLYNGTLAVHVTGKLVAYAGFTRGLEESAAAPPNAVNRNSAPPALETSQRDAGIRYAILPRMSLVAGLFDVRKPYFNLDPGLVYRQLGAVRHRGVELSLAGQPIDGLSVVAGAVLLDADVSGEAVDLGIVGPKPVGTTNRIIRANLDYRLPFFPALSVDLGVTNQGPQVASVREYAELGGRQLMTEAQTLVDVGARYRFKAGGVPATFRAQVTNLFDLYRWKVGANSSFRFIDERRLLLSLAADL